MTPAHGTPALDKDAGSQEPELLQAALAGSQEAFDRLMGLYQEPLLGWIGGRLKDRELAEELVQEAFVRAYQNIHRFNPALNFFQWLSGIAYHVELEWRRKERITRKALDRAGQSRRTQAPAAGETQPLYRRVLRAIGQCPPQYQLPLSLRYLDRMRYEEIAETLELGPGQVRGLLYRGKQMLKEQLADLLGALDEHDELET